MVYQSLYRRYRSRCFAEIKGQVHVVRALRSAVRDDRVGHAYLFSGPRGTGKTSTARILAKALNCDHLDDGDPCGTCESCIAIDQGASFDLHELDAASNNGVEAIRDLIGRTGIGSPGRTKVYVLDEVHMLSTGASNALLKTLEDPPAHVVFVLATTDPHKVLPTIRSRTQHLEFGLLSADVLEAHIRWIIADAALDVSDDGIAYALRQGGGSARDTLSALEQVVAAGGVPDEAGSIDELIEALCDRDGATALKALASAVALGREPRPLAEDLLGRLRDVFLASVHGPLSQLTDQERERVRSQADRLGRASITRALELVGEAIAEMRHVGDTRIPLEVALIRLTSPEVDTSLAALVDRVARLERMLASSQVTPPKPAPAAAAVAEPPPPLPAASSSAPQPPASPVPQPKAPQPSAELPGLEEIVAGWEGSVLRRLSNKARARFGAGRFVAVGNQATFALPNPIHRDRCEELRSEVEDALAEHFGRPVPLRLEVDGPGAAAPRPDRAARADPASEPVTATEDIGDLAELEDARGSGPSTVERLTELFPGAEVMEE